MQQCLHDTNLSSAGKMHAVLELSMAELVMVGSFRRRPLVV
jgi:hypothetical protein